MTALEKLLLKIARKTQILKIHTPSLDNFSIADTQNYKFSGNLRSKD